MKTKDSSVDMKLHPTLTDFLFLVDNHYRIWGAELIITSGSEHTARHSRTSLHYADPACAVDIRTWQTASVPSVESQAIAILEIASTYLEEHNLPTNYIDVVVESDHIHIEYQPKRPKDL